MLYESVGNQNSGVRPKTRGSLVPGFGVVVHGRLFANLLSVRTGASTWWETCHSLSLRQRNGRPLVFFMVEAGEAAQAKRLAARGCMICRRDKLHKCGGKGTRVIYVSCLILFLSFVRE